MKNYLGCNSFYLKLSVDQKHIILGNNILVFGLITISEQPKLQYDF